MKRKLAIMTSLGLTAGLVSGCGGGEHGQASAGAGSGSMTPSSVSLSTGDVLTLAQKTSESAPPFALDAGEISLSDTSETAAPINVDSM